MPEPCQSLLCYSVNQCPFLRTVSFFIRSRLVTRNNLLLSHVISATRILRSSFLRHQHSEPYNTIKTTKVSYNFTLVVFEIFLALHSLLNLFTIADAIPTHLFMSFLHFPFSVMTLPRYVNSSTCCSFSPSSFISMSTFYCPTAIVFVFSPLILRPYRLLLQLALSVSSWSCFGVSVMRSMSPANLRLLAVYMYTVLYILQSLGATGAQNQGFPTDFASCPYNSVAHYRTKL